MMLLRWVWFPIGRTDCTLGQSIKPDKQMSLAEFANASQYVAVLIAFPRIMLHCLGWTSHHYVSITVVISTIHGFINIP